MGRTIIRQYTKGRSVLETQHVSKDLDNETSLTTNQQLKPGTSLANRYMIENVIAVGGMGVVYRARDLHFRNVAKLVAVKEMINQAHEESVRSTIVRNFEREANLLATMEHPAIPHIYDYFSHNERSYLIMDLIDGKTLEMLLNESQDELPIESIIGWGVELCDVLHFLHTHKPEPIIFRDMKPANVMINQRDHVILIDFGIAKHFQSGQKHTMIGTEGYSPPEQYRGEATHLADIYSLGATLHHLLTKRDPRLEPPFSFGERPARKINPKVPLELETVIISALQYNPEDRFPTAKVMKKALLGVARKTGILPQIILKTNTTAQLKEGVKPAWSFTCEDEIRGTPTCHNGVVYIGSYDNNLYALNANTGEFIWKYPTDGGLVGKPAIYKNDVFFGSEDHRLHVVTARYGRVNWTYYTDGAIRSSPHIAEGHVFIGSDDAHLHAVNTLSGRPAWKMDAGDAIRSTPIVNGDVVYFGTETGDFYCLDFKGNVRWRFKARRAVTSSPVVSQGVVYFSSVDSHLYALNAKTGWVIWRFRLGKPSIASPCIAENMIFLGAVDGIIYCVDIKSSKEVWRFTTEHQVTGSPIIYKDSIYCGSVDGHLYCLEYRTGRLRWKMRTAGPITGSPEAGDGLIYIGSTDNRIYAVNA